ncbi:MmyB family transcriptional regulator [Streptomyces sp. NPDC055817]
MAVKSAEPSGELRPRPDEAVVGELVRAVHRERAAGRTRLRHPVAGLLALDFETLHVPAAPGETGPVVHVFSTEEGGAEATALARLTETVTVADRP